MKKQMIQQRTEQCKKWIGYNKLDKKDKDMLK